MGGGMGGHGGGSAQNAFIGMAMAQASQLFDKQQQQGNVVSASFFWLSGCGQGTGWLTDQTTAPERQQAGRRCPGGEDGAENVHEERDGWLGWWRQWWWLDELGEQIVVDPLPAWLLSYEAQCGNQQEG